MSSPLQSRYPRTKQTTEFVAYYFILPALIFYLVFTLIPVGGSIYYSFFEWDGFSPIKTFVGLENYFQVFSDPAFGFAVRNTIIWIVMSLIFQISFALFLAVLIFQLMYGKLFFRTALFLPKVLSLAVVAVIWGRIYDPYIGIANGILNFVGLEHVARGWLGDPIFALPAVQIAHSWNGFGWYMIIYLSALQSIDPVLYEVADIEGAGGWQKFIHVTLPGIRPVHTIVLILSIINSLRTFDTVWAMTRGGPFYRSEVFSTLIYRAAFTEHRMGYGCAASFLLGIVIILLAGALARIRREKE